MIKSTLLMIAVSAFAALMIGCGPDTPDPSDPNLKKNAGKPSASGPAPVGGAGGAEGAAAGATE